MLTAPLLALQPPALWQCSKLQLFTPHCSFSRCPSVPFHSCAFLFKAPNSHIIFLFSPHPYVDAYRPLDKSRLCLWSRVLAALLLPSIHLLSLEWSLKLSVVQLCIFTAQQAPFMAQLSELPWKKEPNRREQPSWMQGALIYSTASPAPGRSIHSTSGHISLFSGLHTLLILCYK